MSRRPGGRQPRDQQSGVLRGRQPHRHRIKRWSGVGVGHRNAARQRNSTRIHRPEGFRSPCRRMMSVAVDPHEKYIAAGGFDGLVRLWDAGSLELIDVNARGDDQCQGGEPCPTRCGAWPSVPTATNWSPDPAVDKPASRCNLIQVWNVETRTPDREPMRGSDRERQSSRWLSSPKTDSSREAPTERYASGI